MQRNFESAPTSAERLPIVSKQAKINESVKEMTKDTFIRGRDVFERMNYLYQLANFWSPINPELAAYYAKLMMSISKKSVLRLHSSIKRTICKGCNFYFLDGITVRTRYVSNHRGQIVKTCNKCGIQKRLPAPKFKKLDEMNEKPRKLRCEDEDL